MRFTPYLRGLLFCSTALASVNAALAQDCLSFASNQTCTNTGALPGGILDGGVIDLTNTETGTIGGGVAVEAQGGGRIDNLGSIDADVFGVLTYSGPLSVTNRGSIHGDAIAIISLDDVTVTNRGDLTGIFGIYGTETVRALNFGSILGTQASGDSYGILGEVVEIDNRGTISGGFNGIGIGEEGRVFNSGTITGTGIGPAFTSFGIMARGDLQLVNRGRIQGQVGVSVNNSAGGTVIDNAGWIIGTEGVAIDMTGLSVSAPTTASAGNSLILRGGSRLDGAVLLGAGDRVQIETGSGISRLVTLSGFEGAATDGNVTALGEGVLVRDGDTYATLDTTGFAQQGQGLLALTQGIAAAAPDATAAQGGAGLSTKGAATRGGWAGVFGATSRFDATGQAVASSDSIGGMVGGLDLPTQGGLSMGLVAGLAKGVATAEASGRVETDYSFAGLTLRTQGAPTWIAASLTGGVTDSESRRSVADNTVEGGLATGLAGYSGRFAALHLAAGRDFLGKDGATWTPLVGVDAVMGQFDGYSESGTAQNLTVGERDARAVSVRLGVERRQTVEVAGGTLASSLSLALVRTDLSDSRLEGTLLGQGFATDSGSGLSRGGIAIGSGLTFTMSPAASLSLRTEGMVTKDGFGGTGAVALTFAF